MNTPDYEKAKIEERLSDNVDSLETQAVPKFKEGDWVCFNDQIGRIEKCDPRDDTSRVAFSGQTYALWISNMSLKLYTGPKEEYSNISQDSANCDKHFDNILKDSFSKERRLNIAAKIMSGMMSNQIMLRNLIQGEATPEGAVKCIVNATMMYADALIAECGFSTRPQESSEKGGTNV